MALTVQIGGDGKLFVGEDKTFRHETVNPQDPSANPDDPTTWPAVDMSGWTVKFVVRKSDGASGLPIFDKTAQIVGVYNPVRSLNTQRAVVTLTDDELNTVKARTYRHSWKRMDDGVETVLSRGDFVVEKATAV